MVLPTEAYNRYKKAVELKYVKHYGLPIIFVVGKPGSGKASLCYQLLSRHDFSFVSMGQILRDEASTNCKRGLEIAKYVYHEPSSKPVPLAIVMEMLKEVLSKLLYIHKPIVIQGFPRTHAQAVALEQEVMSIRHLLNISVSNETAIQRITQKLKYSAKSSVQCEALNKEICDFEKNTSPVVEALRQQDRVVEVDGNGDKDQVFQEVLKVYEKWFKRSRQGSEYLKDGKSLAGLDSYELARQTNTSANTNSNLKT